MENILSNPFKHNCAIQSDKKYSEQRSLDEFYYKVAVVPWTSSTRSSNLYSNERQNLHQNPLIRNDSL